MIYHPVLAATYAPEISRTQIVTVERGGHFLPLDRSDRVIDELKNFVS